MKLAFIHSIFPALTATFVNREFEFLKEKTSIEVLPISMKRPDGDMLNWEYRRYVEITKYLRPDSLLGIMLYNLLALITHPVKYFKTFMLIIQEWANIAPSIQARIVFRFMCGIYLSYFLKKERFDSIHAHFSTASTIALVANRFSGIPYTITLHASDDIYGGAILLEEKMKYAKAVITDSQYNESHINLLTRYRFKDKIKVIYNSLDTSLFHYASAKEVRDNPMNIISVGSFTGCKGYPTVLKALDQLKCEGYKFTYSIIGGGRSQEKDMITMLIDEYGLNNEVILLGRQSFTIVKEKMRKADLLIMASEIFDRGIRDGIPTVISEAMLLKRVVVSTYISDIPNIIEHEVTGYLFHEKRYQDLVDILKYLYYHYEETLKVVERAYMFALERFDAEKNYRQLLYILCK